MPKIDCDCDVAFVTKYLFHITVFVYMNSTWIKYKVYVIVQAFPRFWGFSKEKYRIDTFTCMSFVVTDFQIVNL